jgi:hypothetical protein
MEPDPSEPQTPPPTPPAAPPARDPGQSPWWIVGASFTGLAMGAMLAGGLIGVLEATEAQAAAPRHIASASAALVAPAPAPDLGESSSPDLEADPEVHGDEVLDEAVDVDASAPAPSAVPPPSRPHEPGRVDPAPAVPAPPRAARARVRWGRCPVALSERRGPARPADRGR